ncbi:thioredoxin [candidate division WWE3 bacterium]|nr:thioredoxin [candidate division WWE3 bacterium]
MLEINKANFDQEIKNSTGLVLVDFWAEWCGPCHMLSPTIEALATELAGKVKVGKINVELDPEIAGVFGVRGIPTVILFKNGQPVEQLVGVRNKIDYINAVNKHTAA